MDLIWGKEHLKTIHLSLAETISRVVRFRERQHILWVSKCSGSLLGKNKIAPASIISIMSEYGFEFNFKEMSFVHVHKDKLAR